MINVARAGLPDFKKYASMISGLWDSRLLTNDGANLRSLESRLASHLKAKGTLIAVTNGTAALHLALKAMGVAGEVVTTPFTFCATVNSIMWEGAVPVFSDIDPDTYCIDPVSVEAKITERTTAILAVHVYGNPCDVSALGAIARRRGLHLIYDAAHAFGVEVGGASVLDFGDASTMSFHPTKVFHTIEGGAVVSTDSAIVAKTKLLRNHGILSEGVVEEAGTNAKMDEFRAIMGLCNLDEVEGAMARRKVLYERYRSKLEGKVKFQRITASRYNHAYMPVLMRDSLARDDACKAMAAQGVFARKYFFPLATDFSYLCSRGDAGTVPVARDVASRVLCLPLFPELEETEVDWIATMVGAHA